MNDAIAKLARDAQQIEQMEAHIGGLSEDALRDLARNESARVEFRLEAVKRLIAAGSRHVNHPDLVGLVDQIKYAVSPEVEKPVEEAVPEVKEDVKEVEEPKQDE